MSDRYTRVYTLPAELYSKNSPIMISAGAILKDNRKDRVLAQLKLKNVSTYPSAVREVSVTLFPFSTVGEVLGDPVSFDYMDISVKRDEEFGTQSPIVFPDSRTRSFAVKIERAVFEDGNIWKNEYGNTEAIAERKELEQFFNRDEDLVSEYRNLFGSKAKFWPARHENLWFCTCGAVNDISEKECHACHAGTADLQEASREAIIRLKRERHENIYNTLLEQVETGTVQQVNDAARQFHGKALDIEPEKKQNLETAIFRRTAEFSKSDNIQLLQEAAGILTFIPDYAGSEEMKNTILNKIDGLKKKEAEEKAAEQKRKAGRRLKALFICLALIAAGIGGYFFNENYLIPLNKYKEAVSLMENGDYQSAIEQFEALGEFKNSIELIEECYSAIMKNAGVGDTVAFGNYEQDNDTSNGKEEIEWIVLEKNDDSVTLISKYALDCQPYNTSETEITWETCSLREWLNGTFTDTAFSSEEQSIIASSVVTADNNPKYNTSPGNDTTDKVFLLSIAEAEKYFSTDSERQCQGTAYCYAQGAYKAGNGSCWWWLRSPGCSSDYAAGVGSDGSVHRSGSDVRSGSRAVRPVLRINLGS